MKRGRGDLSSPRLSYRHTGGQKQIDEAGPVLLGNGGLIDPQNLPPRAASNLPKWQIETKSQLSFLTWRFRVSHRQPVERKVSISSTMNLYEGTARYFGPQPISGFNVKITTHQIKLNDTPKKA